MISIDIFSVIVQIVNFIILIMVLNVLLYRPIRSMLRRRKDMISNLQGGIDQFERDARAKEDAFSLGVKAARAKGLKEKEALMEAAAEEERQIIEKINTRAQEDFEALRKKISEDTERVRRSLQEEIDTFADAIGEKILGRTV